MTYREPRDSRRKFYWILARDPDTGKPFLIAGGEDEESAREKGFTTLGGIDFEVRGLYTRNLSRASSIIRGKRLEDTHSLRSARERIGHTKSLSRMIRRQHHL